MWVRLKVEDQNKNQKFLMFIIWKVNKVIIIKCNRVWCMNLMMNKYGDNLELIFDIVMIKFLYFYTVMIFDLWIIFDIVLN